MGKVCTCKFVDFDFVNLELRHREGCLISYYICAIIEIV